MPWRRPHRASRRGVLPAAALVAVSACACVTTPPATAGVHPPPVGADRTTTAVDQDHDGLSDRAELGATAVTRPSLTPLTTALARRRSQPVRLLFLGRPPPPASGELAGEPVRRPGRRPPAGDVPAGTTFPLRRASSATAPTGRTRSPACRGSTAAWAARQRPPTSPTRTSTPSTCVQPACVVHMIGSNDTVARVPAPTFVAQVEDVVRRIDAASTRPPCHVLLQPVRRYQVSLEVWQEYRDALQQLAARLPRATFVDLGSTFEAHDALGADPDDLIGPDAVHPHRRRPRPAGRDAGRRRST